MEPNYVAKKSLASVINILWIIACVLIVPIFIVLYRALVTKAYRIEFYDDKIFVHSGVLNKNRKQVVFLGVTGVSVSQSFRGQIYNYGDVQIDAVGKWDIDTTYIKNPKGLEEYLQSKTAKMQNANQFVQM